MYLVSLHFYTEILIVQGKCKRWHIPPSTKIENKEGTQPSNGYQVLLPTCGQFRSGGFCWLNQKSVKSGSGKLRVDGIYLLIYDLIHIFFIILSVCVRVCVCAFVSVCVCPCTCVSMHTDVFVCLHIFIEEGGNFIFFLSFHKYTLIYSCNGQYNSELSHSSCSFSFSGENESNF